MQQQDQTADIETQKTMDQTPAEAEPSSMETEAGVQASASSQPQRGGFDWLALLVALVIAAFFALTARFNSQPSPSFIPAAVFSATGCGLLVTAIRKLRGRSGIGLREAGLAGFGMALFQFAVTFTYPDVLTTVRTIPELGRAFLLTWGLIALFAVVLSLAGAAIGHLAFAPLRPLPAKTTRQNSADEDEDDEGDDENAEDAQSAQVTETDGDAESASVQVEPEEDEVEDEEVAEEEESAPLAAATARPEHSLVNYVITVLFLGLLPMMAGYVFAATYDFVMGAINVNQISPALYPTLSLLGGLLPWRLPAPINLGGANGPFIVFTLLWRIPDSVLGNPNLFDIQALETLVFNAAALALLLITMYGSGHQKDKHQAAPWGIFLLLQALFGLFLVLPANLWLLRGLEGVLQLNTITAQLPTIQVLNPTLFALNLVTGVVFCLLVGLIVRRQHQLWTTPRQNVPEEE